MKELVLAAKAKINLTLDILGKRSDGYHEVAMIMQSVALSDQVRLSAADALILETNDPRLPGDETNLAYRAAVLLQNRYGVRRGVHIWLEKQIPLAAGLAGGSSDAAAVLKGLNHFWDLSIPEEELLHLGASLGSDVPFCFYGGTALATGRGEIITPLADLPARPVVLAKLPVSVATAHVYQHYQPDAVKQHPDTESVLAAIGKGDWHGVDKCLANVLESVTIPEHPQIAQIKEIMNASGASGSLMSGSGPTVFCLTDDETAAAQIAGRVKQAFAAADVFVTRTAQRER